MAKDRCNLMWLENLNLRSDYRVRILDWIHENHPELDGLYHAIYAKGGIGAIAARWIRKCGNIPPHRICPICVTMTSIVHPLVSRLVVNYFFHEQVKKSTKKKQN